MWHLIAGDFNAVHTAWGYKRGSPKGRQLYNSMQEAGFTLLNGIAEPTRTSNSVERDTKPDLTFCKGALQAKWTNTHNILTSDHAIAQIKVDIRVAKRQAKHGITDWYQIRMERQTVQARSVSEWAQQLETVKKQHTKYVQQQDDQTSANTHLLHLWEARLGLTRRWKKHKTNRRLKARIDRINKEIQEYSDQLSREQWHETCDKLNGTLNFTHT